MKHNRSSNSFTCNNPFNGHVRRCVFFIVRKNKWKGRHSFKFVLYSKRRE